MNSVKPKLVISVVSHGQGALIKDLFSDLNLLQFDGFSSVEVILTLNIPEDDYYISEFKSGVKVIRNSAPLGFGHNHNQAFESSQSDYFAVLNPDLRISSSFSFSNLIEVESEGAIAPRVVDNQGNVEDSFRYYPSLTNIFRRAILRERKPDYICNSEQSIEVDWVAGMFILFNSHSFLTLRGFDTSFFMYLEDADICRRFNQNKFRVVYTANQSVVHDAQRQSFKSITHLRWHLRSMVRFIFKF